MTEKPVNCRNCNHPLTGEFCSHCGQREGRGDLHFSEVAGEVVEELVSWDSRIWRTLLPLLFRPGFLSAEFIAGRRARYVPPFRLYLIVSFLLFLVISLTTGSVDYIQEGKQEDGPLLSSSHDPAAGTAAAGAASEVEEVAARGGGGDSESGPVIAFDLRPHRASEIGSEADRVFAPIVIGGSSGEQSVAADIGFELADEDSPQWLQKLDQRLEVNAEKLSADPGIFAERLLEYLPQMMFLLLPLFALLLKINYLFSPFHYLQHLVFALHFHSFLYLLYLLGLVLGSCVPQVPVLLPVLLVIAAYLPLALRRTYGSSVAGAVAKAFVIVSADTVLLLFGFTLLSLLALALL